MIYRQATTADVPTLARMNLDLIEDEGHRSSRDVDELERRMADWLAGDYRAVMFEQSGRPLGYALFRDEPEHVYLRQFFVRRFSRRQGIGRAAIGWLCQHTWAGAKQVRIDVLAWNEAAIAFWRSVGFKDYCLTMEMDVSVGP